MSRASLPNAYHLAGMLPALAYSTESRFPEIDFEEPNGLKRAVRSNHEIDTAAYAEARRLLSQGEHGALDQCLKKFE